MSQNEMIQDVAKYSVTVITIVSGIYLSLKNWNETRVKLAKEKSVGEEAIRKLNELREKDKREFDQFKIDTVKLILETK